jgi:Fe-S-cluster containining protein
MEESMPATTPEGNEPWYAEGLKFQCTGCGDCCTGAPGYVWVNQAEIAALAARLELSVPEFERRFVREVGVRRTLKERKNYDCVFLDGGTRKCTVYEQRPRQCRTWPWWNSNLKSPEAWQHTCEVCPGSGKGKLYSIDVIEEQRGVINI